ncbi:MAG TPA: glutaminyl-peptide cyclotransferase [Candidatus Krumholzibacteria bacterium]|nr:glutaminyl-peptide cyclotransferase [Candidatus Krumholzibacteria bacterium]
MTHRITVASLLFGLAAIALACDDDETVGPVPPPPPEDTTIVAYTYQVVNEYPHDPEAFTQGLIWDDSVLVEGTGYRNGESSLRRVDLETGVVLLKRIPPDKGPLPVFGEGVTRVGDRIVQLTWTEQIAWVYDAASFDSIGMYAYSTEGWGLTHDGTRFIMSDGTSTLYFRHLQTFAEVGRVTVHDDDGPVINLNELEYIDGSVYANLFELTPRIVIINPATGRLRGRVDLSGILFNPPDVLNGIAWDAAGERLFVTGKLWPRLFEIRLVTITLP